MPDKKKTIKAKRVIIISGSSAEFAFPKGGARIFRWPKLGGPKLFRLDEPGSTK